MATFSAVALLSSLASAFGGETSADQPSLARHGWTLDFSVYSWLPWIQGDIGIGPKSFDVDVSPDQVLRALDWSTIPVWMSYGELRNGRLSLFNDIVYSKLGESKGFGPIDAEADYMQLTVELGAAYEVWTQNERGHTGYTAIDVLTGGRYWRQEVEINLSLNKIERNRSGAVDWVDPFVGARMVYTVAPGQDLKVRGDIGGFGAGSDFSWQAMATYNVEMCVTSTYAVDAYLGYRALSVDYSEGDYTYDTVQHGPAMGVTMRF